MAIIFTFPIQFFMNYNLILHERTSVTYIKLHVFILIFVAVFVHTYRRWRDSMLEITFSVSIKPKNQFKMEVNILCGLLSLPYTSNTV